MTISSLQPIAFGRCKAPRKKRNYELRNIRRNTAEQARNISKWLNACGLTSGDGKVSLTTAKPLEELRDCIQNTRRHWRKMSLEKVSARAKSIIRIANEWIPNQRPAFKAELATVQSLADFIDNPPADDDFWADLKRTGYRTKESLKVTRVPAINMNRLHEMMATAQRVVAGERAEEQKHGILVRPKAKDIQEAIEWATLPNPKDYQEERFDTE